MVEYFGSESSVFVALHFLFTVDWLMKYCVRGVARRGSHYVQVLSWEYLSSSQKLKSEKPSNEFLSKGEMPLKIETRYEFAAVFL